MVAAISKAGLGTGAAFLSNVTWETLEKLDADLAGTGAHLTYLDGCLEITAPFSEAHEEPKNTLGQLLEIYMRMKDIRFYAWQYNHRDEGIGCTEEPDESYCLGTRKSVPDLAIEVTVTSGGIDTLEIYRRVGVQEVWFWEE
jgi:Uma2 family endonuclease